MSDIIQTLVSKKSLSGRVAIITGSSRGIGRDIALLFARAGCNIVVTGKSTSEQKNLPGTIYSVAREVEQLGVKALPVKLDVRKDEDIENMVSAVMKKFGRIDILINNAGALWWKDVIDTPMKKYDLINQINARATFACTRAVLPHMLKQKYGHIITMSPPINLEMLPGKVAYCISKFGMTMIAHGLAKEVEGKGIAINALWPATIIESFASINFKLGARRLWRKASILSDCCLHLCSQDPNNCVTGQALIDEDYLMSIGITDFKKYRCDPDFEPPRMLKKFNIRPNLGLVKEVKGETRIGKAMEEEAQSMNQKDSVSVPGFKVSALFQDIQKRIQQDPSLAKKVKGIYVFQITKDGQEKSWTVDLKNGKVYLGASDAVECTMKMSDDVCVEIMTGQKDATEAFFNGEFSIDGDMSLAMKLNHLTKQPRSKL